MWRIVRVWAVQVTGLGVFLELEGNMDAEELEHLPHLLLEGFLTASRKTSVWKLAGRKAEQLTPRC